MNFLINSKKARLILLAITLLCSTILWSQTAKIESNNNQLTNHAIKNYTTRADTAYSLTVYVSSSNNQSIAGAKVTLENTDTDYYEYKFISENYNYVYFYDAPYGTYTIIVEKEGFITHIAENVVIAVEHYTHPQIILDEFPNPARNVNAYISADVMYISWEEPISNFVGYTPYVTYSVWRTHVNLIDDEPEWTLIDLDTNQYVTTDTTWADAPYGQYVYAVKAKYQESYYSEPTFSDMVANSAKVTVYADTNDGRSADDTRVYIYGVYNPFEAVEFIEDGEAVIYNVPFGTYHINVEKFGYYPTGFEYEYILETEHVLDPVLLERNPLPPSSVDAVENDGYVHVSWTIPGVIEWANTRNWNEDPFLYTIWRCEQADLRNEENWDLLAEDLVDLEYEDFGWNSLTEGKYFYHVNVKYTDEIISYPKRSNPVDKEGVTYVHLPVSTSDGRLADGAVATLTSLDDNQLIYTEIVSDGMAIFENVEDGMYDISVTLDGYYSFLLESVSIFGDTQLDEIFLYIIPVPATNVIATDYTNSVGLTWDAPNDDNGYPLTMEFKIYRLNEDDIDNKNNWVLLEELFEDNIYYDYDWYSVEPGTYQYAVLAMFGGEDEAAPAFSNTVTKGEFSNVMVRLATNDGASPDGAKVTLTNHDEDPDHVYEVIASNHAGYFTDVPFGTYSIFIEKNGYHSIEYEEVLINVVNYEHPLSTLQKIVNPPTNVLATPYPSYVNVTWDAPSIEYLSRSNTRGAIPGITYTIWRSLEGEVSDEDDWVLLATNISTTYYDDNTWNNADYDSYVYIVKAYYSENVVSGPAYSNVVTKDPTCYIFISISTSDQASADGAVVTLTNQNNNPDYVYSDVVTPVAAGVGFPAVWFGTYTITVEKVGYETYIESDVIVNVPAIQHPTIILQKLPEPPTNVVAIDYESSVEVTWIAPMDDNGDPLDANYKIVRTLIENIENSENWTVLKEEYSGTQYYDNDWLTIDPGQYVYMIAAVYDDDTQSAFVSSNTVTKGEFSTVIVRLETSDDASSDGATVTLVNNNENPDHVFEVVASNNAGYFTNIPFGTYSIEVELVGYTPVLVENIVIETTYYEHAVILLNKIIYPATNVYAEAFQDHVTISWDAPQTIPGTALDVTYNIWRLLSTDEEDEQEWVVISEGFEDTQINDSGWATTMPDVYKYAVQVIYDDGTESEIAFSNEVTKLPFSHVSIQVMTSDGTNSAGAVVTLTSTDSDSVYTTTIDTRVAQFPAVWFGTYDLSIEKDGYVSYLEEDVVIDDVYYQHPVVTLEKILYPATNVYAEAFQDHVTISWDAPQTTLDVTYTIFRLLSSDEEFEDAWEIIEEDYEMTQINDNGWATINPEVYKYAVKAYYSNGVLSDPEFSNEVTKLPFSHVSIQVMTSDGTNSAGAVVTLTSTDSDSVYTTTIDTRVAQFPAVWFGTYDLSIEKDGYVSYLEEDVVIDDVYYQHPVVTLEKILYPPTNVIAEIVGQNVDVSWDEPNNNIIIFANKRTNRSPISYVIWRSLAENSNNEEAWSLLGNNLTNTNYTDMAWNNLSSGNYLYIVKAVYSGGVSSEPAFSNIIEKHPLSNVNIILSTSDGQTTTGALVTLTNIDNDPEHVYTKTADPTSQIVNFPTVWYGTYTIQVEKDGYHAYTQENVLINQLQYTHPLITLNEIAYTPTNFVVSTTQTRATLNWSSPNIQRGFRVSTDSDRALTYYRIWRAPLETVENVATWTSIVNNFSGTSYNDNTWASVPIGEYQYIIKAIYTGGLESEAVLSNVVEKQPLSNVSITLNTNDNQPAAGAVVTLTNGDGNPDHTYTQTADPTSQIVNFPAVWYGTYTINVEKQGYYSVTIEGILINQDQYTHPTITLEEIAYPPANLVASVNQSRATLSWDAPNANRNTRLHASYQIWRSPLASINNDEEWTEIATNITATSYTDNSWAQVAIGDYQYIVKAIYSSGSESIPVFSNTVSKDPLSSVSIVLATSDNQPTSGAVITLTNYDGNPDHIYTQTANPTSQIVSFPAVWYGTYTIHVNKQGYHEYTEEGVEIDQEVYEHSLITLEEIAYPPSNLVVTTTRTQATLFWNAPSNRGLRVFVSYKIWRSAIDTIEDDSTWSLVSEDVNAISYIDNTWEELSVGEYQYIVKAIYTTGLESEAVFSNTVNKEPISTATFTLATTDNQSADGATITLTNNDGNPDHIYVGTADPTSQFVTFNEVWFGEYTVDVEKDGYHSYTENNVIIDQFEYSHETITLMEIAYPPTNFVATATREEVELSWNAPGDDTHIAVIMSPRKETISLVRKNTKVDVNHRSNSRGVIGYQLWRSKLEDIEQADLWAEIVNDFEETEYTDLSWGEVASGEYKYILKAIYTGDLESDEVYSNSVIKEPYSHVTIVIETEDGEPAEGARITLKNMDDNTEIEYSEIAISDELIFPEVLFGTYKIYVEKHGYLPAIEDNVEIYVDEYIHETIILELNNFFFVENFEGSVFPPDGWTIIDADEDGYNWHVMDLEANAYSGSQFATSASYINGIGPLLPDNWLITKPISLPEGSTYGLTYWIGARDPLWPEEYYSVLVSTTDNDIDSFEEIYSETVETGEYSQRIINLPYAGEEIYIAFRHYNSTDWYFISLDDVEVGLYVNTDDNAIEKPNTKLFANYPNPFNPETTINFEMEKDAYVTIDIYNAKGQKVKTLVNEHKRKGMHSVIWNGKDGNGQSVGSGIYFYNMKSGKYTSTRKMILMK
ncbi:MAG: FlgD immunoglobulin-like domain containing protein [Candidatus Cloacimonadales bacterium]